VLAGPEDLDAFERCIAVGGVALFPADTVYGLATEPDSKQGVRRIWAIKGRAPDKPSAVMFFSLDLALEALPELGERTRHALERLLPGALTLVVANPARRFPLASGLRPDSLGLRVPDLPALAAVRWPILQSSANLAGEAEARRLADVDPAIRRSVDLQLDGGELAGTPSTVVDLSDLEAGGGYTVVREGAVPSAEVESALG